MAEKEIGKVSAYFGHASVAAIKLSGNLKIGDRIHIKGHTSDFQENVQSMQVHKEEVQDAKKGDHVGIKVSEKVRPNDKVFLVE